ncbi:MAG: hypothetical protein IT305_07145 [Chloroflexi bacterium]|nr:hypothetical protein [Chloroflexota bacterium]
MAPDLLDKEDAMFAPVGVHVSVNEAAATARVEVRLPSNARHLAFTVWPSPHGRGWDVREPIGGAFAWRESFDDALGVAVAAASETLDDAGGFLI